MNTRQFQHTIPKKPILRHFIKKQTLFIYNKKEGIKRINNIKNPDRPVEFGAYNYYGNKDILGDIETKISPILSKIRNSIKLNLSPEEEGQLMEYVFSQHIRTPGTRCDIDSFKNMPDFLKVHSSARKERLPEDCFAKIVSEYSGSNQTEIIKKQKTQDDFNSITEITKKNIVLLVNHTPIPFVLPDRGLITTEEKDEIRFYLPISPQLCLLFTKQKQQTMEINVNQTQVEDINEVAWLAAYKELYCNDEKYLSLYSEKMKHKSVKLNQDGTKEFC